MELSIYLPEKVITNDDLKLEFPEWNYSKIQEKIGIRKRHIVNENETALDLALRAAEILLKNKDLSSIDFTLLCTQSPEYFLPTTACIIQDKLGLPKRSGAIDINLGCSGYVYGLAIAKGLLKAGVSKNLLFITAETYSKHIYHRDISNRAIFGDAATATLISYENNYKIKEFTLGTDGSGKDNLIVKNRGMKFPFKSGAEEIEYGTGNFYTDNNLYMNGPEIFNFTIDNVPPLIHANLAINKLSMDDIDYFIFHQANQFMLEYLRKKIKIPTEKFCIDIENTGNTVSNTIPIALKNAIDKGIIRAGQKVMLVGFGVGYSWGAVTIEI